MLSLALLSAAIFVASATAQGTAETLDTATYVNSHNAARANWAANPLTAITDAAFNAATQDWANACVFQHSAPNGAYGENLYAAGSTGAAPTVNFQSAMDAWMGESSAYCTSLRTGVVPLDENGTPEQTGHFTQVVWKSTTTVSCAVASCPPETIFKNTAQPVYSQYYVCRYRPAGNVQDQYVQNVDSASCPVQAGPSQLRARLSVPRREITLGGSELFACGSAEVDCSSIADAAQVSCQAGQCVVESCLKGEVSEDQSSCN